MNAALGGTPTRQTWGQRRAAGAWERIGKRTKRGDTGSGGGPAAAEQYARAAKQTSTRILTAGLGQALAFLLAKAAGKAESPLRWLYNDVSGWVLNERKIGGKGEHLLDAIINGDDTFLRRATDESLAYLDWLTRFAEAEGLYRDGDSDAGSAP